MSGWIKIEKDLETDPRVMRMVNALLASRDVTQERYTYWHAVTLVSGALQRLWIYADSHIREDDTLDMSAAELDEWLGIEGFCKLMPKDWLVMLADDRTHLPGFIEKNGVVAKKKALTAKRVAKHRSNAAALQPAKPRNAGALPDQTRPDQTRPEKKERTAGNPLTPVELAWFTEFKSIYPKRAGDQNWRGAERAAHARRLEGHTGDEILEGARRYAQFIRATGKERTEFVKQAATFLGPGKSFLEAWTLPTTKADSRLSSNLSAAEEFMRRTEPTP